MICFEESVVALAGELHWKIVSVYINRMNQVRLFVYFVRNHVLDKQLFGDGLKSRNPVFEKKKKVVK